MTPKETQSEEAWQPGLASKDIEERMERADVAESDRDEVRRFSEFLVWRKHKLDRPKIVRMPDSMKDWLTGE